MTLVISLFYLISVHFTHAYPGDKNTYEPYMPFKMNLKPQELQEFRFDNPRALRDKNLVLMHRCPPETDFEISNIEISSKNNYKLKYCLFERIFQDYEDVVCRKEPKPVLTVLYKEIEGMTCGPSPTNILYTFAYHYCGKADVIRKFEDEYQKKDPEPLNNKTIERYNYEFCYDTVNKQVLWTRHIIMDAEFFLNPYLKNQKLPETGISTDSYFIDEDTFLDQKRKYEMQINKDASNPANFIMVPQPISPPSHIAQSIWKKTAHHYINMAPLWDKLVPLMNSIDERIRKVQLGLYSKDPIRYNHSDDLTIITKVVAKAKTGISLEPNIWYKFVHRRSKKSDKTGLLVVIHNDPGNPPAKGCTVGEQKSCHFATWSDDERIRQQVSAIGENQYAFCCKVDEKHIKKIFSYKFNIEGYMDLNLA